MSISIHKPVLIQKPSQLQELLNEDGHPPIQATGTGTLLGRGLAPELPVTPLDMSALNRIVDHAHEDLTVTVESGVRFKTLNKTLGKKDQWLPLDPFAGEGGTIGGLIAADRRGPLSGGMGTIRDFLIGIRLVDGTGNVVSAGGKVVKNVAGYDLMKLMIGSLGELGVVIEATLRVLPQPECWGAVELANPDVALVRKSQSDLASSVSPLGLWRVRHQGDENMVAVFAGSRIRVTSQINQTLAAWGPRARTLEENEIKSQIAELTARLIPTDTPVGWGGALPAFLAGGDLNDLFGNGDGLLDLLRGHLWWFPASGSLDPVVEIRRALAGGEGHLHLDVPPNAKISFHPWGRVPEEELGLWRQLKSAADPFHRLVRGRLMGGI